MQMSLLPSLLKQFCEIWTDPSTQTNYFTLWQNVGDLHEFIKSCLYNMNVMEGFFCLVFLFSFLLTGLKK